MNIRSIKHYSPQEVFNYTQIGVIWEFYSSKEDNFIVEDLSKLTAKNIILTNNESVHPSFSSAVLLKEYESKHSRYSLILSTQQYFSIYPIIQNVNKWLSENAQTTLDTLMKVILTFDERHLQTFRSISEMDVSRLLLKFDESYIYKRLSEQENSPFAISVKKLIPINGYVNTRNLSNSMNNSFILPKNTYYGINFSSQPMGVLEFNYIGGKDYPSKQKEINEVIEYYVIKTYQSLNETEYTKFEVDEMDKLTKNLENIQDGYYDVNEFFKIFPNIKLSVDLNKDIQVIKTFWTQLRNKIYETITNCNFVKGEINYDTELGRFQLRNAEINSTLLSGYDVLKCKINGVLENCELWNCEINNSRLYNSTLVNGNNVNKTFLYGVKANTDNKINQCYIINNDEILNCQINESIVKFASLGKNAKLDESSIIINRKDPEIIVNKGIEIKETRDYNWLKTLDKTKVEVKGYANEYKITRNK